MIYISKGLLLLIQALTLLVFVLVKKQRQW